MNTYIDSDIDGDTKVIKFGIGRYENGTLLNFKVDEEYKKNHSWLNDYEFYPNGSLKRTQNIDDGIIEEEFYGENGIDYSNKEIIKETNEVRYEVNQKVVGNTLIIESMQLKNKEYVKSKIVYEFASPEEIVFVKSEEGDKLTVKNASIKYYRDENLIEELNVKNGKIQGRHYYADVIDEVEKKQDIDFGNSGNGKYIGVLYYYTEFYENAFYFILIDPRDQEVIEGNLIDGKEEGLWKQIWIDYDEEKIINRNTLNSMYKNGKTIEANYVQKNSDDIIEISINERYNSDGKETYRLESENFENSENTENKKVYELNGNKFIYKEIIDNKEVREVRYENKLSDDIKIDTFISQQEIPTITGKLTLLFDNKLSQVINYKDRLFNGEYIAYKDGKEYYKTNFNNGTGYYKDYDGNSKSSNEGKFVEGLKDGLWKRTYYFDEIKGETTIERVYSMGILQSVKSDYQMKKYENGNLIYDASGYNKEEEKYGTENYL